MGSLPQLSIIKGSQKPNRTRLLQRIFEENVDKEYGIRTALIDESERNRENKTLTYHALNSKANRVARVLLEKCKQGKPNNDNEWIIAVCIPPSESLIVTLLAIWKCGAAYLPLDVSFPPNRIKHIINEARPCLIVFDDQAYQHAENFDGVESMSYDDINTKKDDFSNANISPSETLTEEDDNVAIVLYTSGSTGVPKGVRLTNSAILNRLYWQWTVFPFSKSESTSIFKTALTFVDSVSEIWSPLLNGNVLNKVFF